MSSSTPSYYYAVKRGFKTGIYKSWPEAQKQIKGYKYPQYKKFLTMEDAKLYLNIEDVNFEPDTKNIKVICNLEDNFISDVDKWNTYDKSKYIFTDGSQKKIGVNGSIIRYGVYFGRECINIGVQLEYSTNNRAELTAILVALEQIWINKDIIYNYQYNTPDTDNNYIDKIYIVLDSEYVINSCNKWMNEWAANGWILKSTGKPVLNQDIFKKIYLLLNKIKLKGLRLDYIHVQSHQPPPISDKYKLFLWEGNHIVDLIAQNKLSLSNLENNDNN